MALVMYSTNTRLAFMINQKYYNQLHYVYCCPYFDPRSVSDLEHNTPPSSSPCELFRDFTGEASRNDKHPKSIAVNKAGLQRGAVAKLDSHVITPDQHRDILEIIAGADAAEFRPLLYVIPFEIISAKIRPVPLEKKAHPFSEEYIIDELNRTEFDVVEFKG